MPRLKYRPICVTSQYRLKYMLLASNAVPHICRPQDLYDGVIDRDIQWMLDIFDLIDSKEDGFIDSIELQHAFKA
eukprot:scaffold680231_cov36-Prasinocladus_malaysianus.AAC.1